jgi:hypothetical protein
MDDTQGASPETPTLHAATPQEELLRESLDHGLADLPDAIGLHAQVAGVHLGTLATLPSAQVCGGGERIAGILVRFSGRLGQVGLFAMEPEEAFELVRHDPGTGDPLSWYTAVGRELLRTVALSIDLHGVTQEGDASLREDSVIGVLLETHAPSDTAVVSVQLNLSCVGIESTRAAHVYLLADPKPFAAAVGAG